MAQCLDYLFAEHWSHRLADLDQPLETTTITTRQRSQLERDP